MRGRKTTRYTIVSLLNARDMIAAHKRVRRFRPWMWGPLRNRWMFQSELVQFPYVVVGKYRWKNKVDRMLSEQLNQCCGVPKGEKCSSHGGRHA